MLKRKKISKNILLLVEDEKVFSFVHRIASRHGLMVRSQIEDFRKSNLAIVDSGHIHDLLKLKERKNYHAPTLLLLNQDEIFMRSSIYRDMFDDILVNRSDAESHPFSELISARYGLITLDQVIEDYERGAAASYRINENAHWTSEVV